MNTATLVASERPTLFGRLADSTELRQARWAREIDAYPFAHVFDDPSTNVFRTPDGREVVNFGSNNYLGLTTHPQVVQAVHDAVDRYGSGCSGSRLLNGTNRLHASLEEELADFFGMEAAMVTSTGFSANTAATTGLVQKDDWFVCDRDIHASLAEGIAASGANSSRFRHNDIGSLQKRLRNVPEGAGLMVVVEGVYSVDGTVAPIGELADITHRAGGVLLVDDAHGVGVFGERGRGAAETCDSLDKVDLLTMTFSKALASCGGAVVGPADAVEEIQHRAASYLFMAANVPAAVAAARESLRVLRADPELPALARAKGDRLRAVIRDAGWRVAKGEGPIVSVPVPNVIYAGAAFRILYELGAYCNVQIPPAVPKGRAALRFSAITTHTDEQIDRLHDIITRTQQTVRNLRAPGSG